MRPAIRIRLPAAQILLITLAAARPAAPTIVPDGFVHEPVVTGPFSGPVVGFDFLPDGRVMIIERETGNVRLSAVGSAVADSVSTIPGVNANNNERGLLGVAVDPAWPLRPYVYFDLTHVGGVTRVVMYEASGALTDPASTAITLANPFLLIDDIPDTAINHNGGTLRFGPDGMLYVSTGDDATPCEAQDLASPLGKILRLDVSSMPGGGAGPPPIADLEPADNPYPGTQGFGPLVYAWGLRNPFRFTIDQQTGDVFVGDVGWNSYEEIDLLPGSNYAGNNYGWPQFEGPLAIDCCGTCGQGNVFTDPVHVITHPPKGYIAITGGPRMRSVATSPVSFPSTYDGDYFYCEYFTGTVHRLRETAGTWDFAPPVPGQPDPQAWAADFPKIADARLGADGALYLLCLGGGVPLARGLHRIRADATAVGVAAAPSPLAHQIRAIPNPAFVRAGTTLAFQLERSATAVLEIYDAGGRLVRTLVDPATRPGPRAVAWDGFGREGRPASAGVYWVRLQVDGESVGHGKITLLR